MFEAAVTWAKEYGDVLGTIGFLFALTTVVYTNGRVIMLRLRGQPVAPVEPPLALSTISATTDLAPVVNEYGDKTPIAVTTPSLLGQVEQHFSQGLAEDIITDLQSLGFAVPDITTVDAYLSRGESLQAIARQMQVPFVLTSSVRRQDDRVRISVKLIAQSGAVTWSERFDSEGDDLMAIQTQTAGLIAKGVAQVIKPKNVIVDPSTGRAFATREQALRVVSSPKSRLTAFMLCAPLLGIFGAHRFYVGRPWTGTLYFCTAGLFLFGWLIDCVLIILGMFADGNNKPLAFWRPDPLVVR